MRELITVVICIVLFMVALQSGLIKTGLDYTAVSENNENLKQVNEQLTTKLKQMNEWTKGADRSVSAGQVARLERMEKAKEQLKKQLAREIKTREVELKESGEQFKLVLLDKVLFARQSDQIQPGSRDLLHKIAKIINYFDNLEIEVAGYTNNQPIAARFRKKNSTHLKLSVSRAVAVAKFLQREGQVDPVQIKVAGFGTVRPVVPNDSEYHRTINGRIEISLNPVDPALLSKARDIYRTESLLPGQGDKKKALPREEYEPEYIESLPEAIGEDALSQDDEMKFDAGYELPEP